MSEKTNDPVLCRLCGEETEKYLDVLDEKNADKKLITKIALCLQIMITKRDVFPTTICLNCNSELDISYDFFQRAYKTQLLFRSMCKQIDKQIIDSAIKIDCKRDNINDPVIVETQQCMKGKSIEMNKSRVDKTEKKDTNSMNYEPPWIDPDDPIEETHKSVTDKTKLRKSCKADARSTTPTLFEILQTYTWTCSICENLIVENFQELSKHYTIVHDSAPTLKCNICDRRYEQYKSFTKHMKLHYTNKTYNCEICQKSFKLKTSFDNHRSVHSKERQHVCNTCGKAFKQSKTLLAHQIYHIPDEAKKFSCNCCDKKFAAKHALKRHIKAYHEGERNFLCDICGKAFTAKTTLSSHLSTHFIERNFKCSSCEWSFKSARYLKRHEALHSTLKPYQCDVCGKQFRYRSSLVCHNRVHSGVMPYSCEYCGRLFKFSGSLTIHRRQHTGEKPYSCSTCQRTFTDVANYNKHKKRVHPSNELNLPSKKSAVTEDSHK